MALLSQNLDYTDKDFASIRSRLQALVQSVYPDWSDFNRANFGNILLELFAFTGDTLAFYQDNQAKESRLTTATQRKNLIALTKLIAYKAFGAKAATVDVAFTLAAPPVGTVVIPAGTIVKTADTTSTVEFQLLSTLTFSALQNPPVLIGSVENSTSQNNVFQSDGLPNQSFSLPETPYLDDSAIVTAGDGIYTQVDNFLNSTGTDKHFTVQADQNDKATISFGNGVNGKIPVVVISVDYKTGGGNAGNVDPNSLTRIDQGFVDSFSNPVTVTVTNTQKSNGGSDRETVNQIKLLAPESLLSLASTVSRIHFEINARRISGVARALMTTSNEDVAVPENRGILYIVPTGGGFPSQALKDSVKALFESNTSTPPYPSTLTFHTNVLDPVYKTINVTATVYFRAGVSTAIGAAAIRTSLATFFQISNTDGTPNSNIDFGYNYKDANGIPIGTIALSDIFNAVRDTAEVLRVGGLPTDFFVNGGHQDVPLTNKEFPVLGTVTLINGVTGGFVLAMALTMTNLSFEAAGTPVGEATAWAWTFGVSFKTQRFPAANNGISRAEKFEFGWGVDAFVNALTYSPAPGYNAELTVFGVDNFEQGWGNDSYFSSLTNALPYRFTSVPPNGPVEDFESRWSDNQFYLFRFRPSNLSAGPTENFESGYPGQAAYKTEFTPGDTTEMLFTAGAGFALYEDFENVVFDQVINVSTPFTFNVPAHGFSNGNQVKFFTTVDETGEATLPAGINSQQKYFVVSATTNTFQVSTTFGGSPQTMTDNGSGNSYVRTDVKRNWGGVDGDTMGHDP